MYVTVCVALNESRAKVTPSRAPRSFSWAVCRHSGSRGCFPLCPDSTCPEQDWPASLGETNPSPNPLQLKDECLPVLNLPDLVQFCRCNYCLVAKLNRTSHIVTLFGVTHCTSCSGWGNTASFNSHFSLYPTDIA